MTKLLTLIHCLHCFIFFHSLNALQWTKSYGLETFAGPEIYYVHRTKEGGSKQSGPLWGIRAGYDRISRCKIYWGVDGLWARGILKGKTERTALRSQFTDGNIEARVGYTFQSKYWRAASFTPFVGGGYFWENNKYLHPSPLTIHFQNQFSYIPIGFLSQIFISPNFSVGLNAKVRVLLESKLEVSNDPEHENLTQHYEEKLQYRIEIPLMYFSCFQNHSLAMALVPFYEYRPYGHRVNFPFDFLETRLKLYGATFKFFYLF